MNCTPQMVSMERKNRVTIRTKVAAGPFHGVSANETIPGTMENRAARRRRLQGGGRQQAGHYSYSGAALRLAVPSTCAQFVGVPHTWACVRSCASLVMSALGRSGHLSERHRMSALCQHR